MRYNYGDQTAITIHSVLTPRSCFCSHHGAPQHPVKRSQGQQGFGHAIKATTNKQVNALQSRPVPSILPCLAPTPRERNGAQKRDGPSKASVISTMLEHAPPSPVPLSQSRLALDRSPRPMAHSRSDTKGSSLAWIQTTPDLSVPQVSELQGLSRRRNELVVGKERGAAPEAKTAPRH